MIPCWMQKLYHIIMVQPARAELTRPATNSSSFVPSMFPPLLNLLEDCVYLLNYDPPTLLGRSHIFAMTVKATAAKLRAPIVPHLP